MQHTPAATRSDDREPGWRGTTLKDIAQYGRAMAIDLGDERLAAARPVAEMAETLEGRFIAMGRAVRDSIGMHAKLEQDEMRAGGGAGPGERSWRDRDDILTRRRKRAAAAEIYFHLERSVRGDPEITDKVQAMIDLNARLGEADIRAMLDRRPVVEIIAVVCGDLGIKPDCSQFTDAMLAHEFPDEDAPESDPWRRPAGPFDRLPVDGGGEADLRSGGADQMGRKGESEAYRSRINWQPVVQPSGNIVSYAFPPGWKPPGE